MKLLTADQIIDTLCPCHAWREWLESFDEPAARLDTWLERLQSSSMGIDEAFFELRDFLDYFSQQALNRYLESTYSERDEYCCAGCEFGKIGKAEQVRLTTLVSRLVFEC